MMPGRMVALDVDEWRKTEEEEPVICDGFPLCSERQSEPCMRRKLRQGAYLEKVSCCCHG